MAIPGPGPHPFSTPTHADHSRHPQIQALEATLAEMQKRVERLTRERDDARERLDGYIGITGDARTNVGADWDVARKIAGYRPDSVRSPSQEWFCRGAVRALAYERAEAEVARLKAALDAKPATYQEVDGILGGAGADLRALRDEYVDALALEGENGSMESGRRFIAARRALAAALAKQGEVCK
jgi:hypothetical protein